ncbi:MAG: single-stranded-DNA-specific exonuclease RecJ [Chloroflexi bacterium]|nr:single-stranded-DNA-specific exonuclease RecJ [Chloroflexota bacterium]
MTLRSRWVQRPTAPAAFLHELPASISPLVGQVLWSRQITDPDAVKDFLDPDYRRLHDPFALRDMDRAVDRIRQAVEADQTVAVYGDFDTDGVTGVALLKQALSALGLRVLPYIPRRIEEGYGLNIPAIEQLATKADLLITVDCGISNVDEIARAQALGLDVIVLDHHTPPAVLPQGYAVINPKRGDCDYPYDMLAGVGVAYKLTQALHKIGMRTNLRGRDLLDVVALGTVTDMAPLNGENRILVKHGLLALNESERPGIKALIEASASRRPIDTRTIGFVLGPRLNAAGRLDNAIRAYDLLLATTDLEAQVLAEELNEINLQRQNLTKEVQSMALERAAASGKHQQRIVVLDDKDFPSGVVGLVAARLVEAWGRPVLLLERGENTSRGSARSVEGFSIIGALTEVGELFEKFGGHTMAAGFTITNERLPELESRLQQIAARDLPDDLLTPRLYYDAELALDQMNIELVELLAELEPYGHGNPEPVWVTRGLKVVDAFVMGRERQHLKLRLFDGRTTIDALWWRNGEHVSAFSKCPRVDVAYTLSINEYMGRRRVQMIVKELVPTVQ